jgi:HJR/Mrr/RecB family endonuclease
MARRKKSEEVLGILFLIIGAPIFFANWIHDKTGIPRPVTYIVLGLIVVAGLCLYFAGMWVYFAEQNQRFRAIQIANIDSMTGMEFERYLRKLLTSQGYSVSITPGSGDLGVDLIAARGVDRIAIQVKRYNSKVSRRAISDAVAGMHHYKCNQAMVITNNTFTPGALTLARSTGCALIDRNTLSQWIVQLQNANTGTA